MHNPSDETEQYDEPDKIVQRGGDAVCALVKPTVRARKRTQANTPVNERLVLPRVHVMAGICYKRGSNGACCTPRRSIEEICNFPDRKSDASRKSFQYL